MGEMLFKDNRGTFSHFMLVDSVCIQHMQQPQFYRENTEKIELHISLKRFDCLLV